MIKQGGEDLEEKEKIITGSKWVALTTLMTASIGMITTLLLPKFINPKEFGIFALGGMVVTIGQRLLSFGQSEFIISRKDGEVVRHTVFSSYLIGNLLIMGIQISISGYLASYFNEYRLRSVLCLMALNYLITPFMLVPASVLSRELDFKKKFWPEITGVVAYTIIALILAIFKPDVYTLILASICSNFVTMLMLCRITRWNVKLRFDRNIFTSLIRYGYPLFISGILTFISGGFDRYIIGKALNSQDLGFYTVAFQLTTIIPLKVSAIFSTIALPAYSKIYGQNYSLENIFIKMLSLSALVGTIIYITTFVLVKPFIEIYYGNTWLPAIVPARIFALYGFASIISSPIMAVFFTLEKTKIVFINSLFASLLTLIVLPLIAPYGIIWVAYATTLITWVNVIFVIIMAVLLLELKLATIRSNLLMYLTIPFMAFILNTLMTFIPDIARKWENIIIAFFSIISLIAIFYIIRKERVIAIWGNIILRKKYHENL